jgi:hypothetical protein
MIQDMTMVAMMPEYLIHLSNILTNLKKDLHIILQNLWMDMIQDIMHVQTIMTLDQIMKRMDPHKAKGLIGMKYVPTP